MQALPFAAFAALAGTLATSSRDSGEDAGHFIVWTLVAIACGVGSITFAGLGLHSVFSTESKDSENDTLNSHHGL
jgi:hypothetical protein